MGLVKTRRLAAMQKQQRAIHLRQGYGERVGGLKSAMKPLVKGGAGKDVPRQFASAGAKAPLGMF